MKPFKTYNEEKFVIPTNEIDNILNKTLEIVKYEIKRDVEIGKDNQQGSLNLEILTLLKNEWDNKRVERNFVFRITDKIFKTHTVRNNFYSDVELG
tara:strand:- start:90 stop:377 length:288 start_codon:yes stop_codon:yes gene_type:complete